MSTNSEKPRNEKKKKKSHKRSDAAKKRRKNKNPKIWTVVKPQTNQDRLVTAQLKRRIRSTERTNIVKFTSESFLAIQVAHCDAVLDCLGPIKKFIEAHSDELVTSEKDGTRGNHR